MAENTKNVPTKWNLEKYYYTGLDDPKFISDMESVIPEVKKFREKYENTLKTFTKAEEIKAFYEDDEKLGSRISKVALYLFYRESLNSQDPVIIKKQGELQSLSIAISNELLFVSQAWKAIGYDRLMEWSRDPLLEGYSNDLRNTAESIKRILSEKEEYVLNVKSRPLAVTENLSEELMNSLMFEVEVEGEKKMLTDAEVRALRESPNRETRKNATLAIKDVYVNKQLQIALGNCYSGILKDWSTKLTLRGYSTVMEPRNVSEEMENEVVDLLLSEVQNAYPLYSRYLKAKQKILGLETFYQHDVFAPISTDERSFPLEEGLALHLETMKEFDGEFYEYSKRMFEEERVDVFPYAGKRGWAFASYTKNEPSFVLLNYTGKLNDVPTLSHELGHAIHGHLSQAQKECAFDSPLCLAETASIFSEMLLADKLKKQLSDEEKIDFLSGELQDAFASIFRQIQYVLFEKRAHETIHSGGELTYHDFNAMWREEQIKMSGDAVTYLYGAEEEVGWSTIPHIFRTPFYCYAYSFGNLLVYSLFERYKSQGKSFIEDYKSILRAGGSKRPKDLLMEYGFDITKPEFYRLGLSIMEEKVKEFEALAEKVGKTTVR